jgi:hypothetical protein
MGNSFSISAITYNALYPDYNVVLMGLNRKFNLAKSFVDNKSISNDRSFIRGEIIAKIINGPTSFGNTITALQELSAKDVIKIRRALKNIRGHQVFSHFVEQTSFISGGIQQDRDEARGIILSLSKDVSAELKEKRTLQFGGKQVPALLLEINGVEVIVASIHCSWNSPLSENFEDIKALCETHPNAIMIFGGDWNMPFPELVESIDTNLSNLGIQFVSTESHTGADLRGKGAKLAKEKKESLTATIDGFMVRTPSGTTFSQSQVDIIYPTNWFNHDADGKSLVDVVVAGKASVNNLSPSDHSAVNMHGTFYKEVADVNDA